MPAKKHTFWEISFYISLLLILLWLILKMTGVINTPPFLEYGLPILSAVYASFSIYRDILDRIGRIDKGLTKAFMKIELGERNMAIVQQDIEYLKR